ncbi:MAG: hypothetical protein ACE1Z6_12110, partial [Candidatus Methylomirabilales bacterium]
PPPVRTSPKYRDLREAPKPPGLETCLADPACGLKPMAIDVPKEQARASCEIHAVTDQQPALCKGGCIRIGVRCELLGIRSEVMLARWEDSQEYLK